MLQEQLIQLIILGDAVRLGILRLRKAPSERISLGEKQRRLAYSHLVRQVLRAAGEVTDIRAADLAFRPEETAELLSRHGMHLSDDAVTALTDRTGGWAAGLRLCTLAAQGADDPETFLKDLEAGRSTLADFLLAEVLHAQPVETQDLLLRTSVLEQIHPDLANALTGRDDPPAMAEFLQEHGCANAVIKLDAQGALCRNANGESRLVDAYRVDRVVDSTGAGD